MTSTDIPSRRLGSHGPAVGAIGLGCMPFSSYYGAADEADARRVLERALDLGVTLWDTAEVYGQGANEELLAPLLQRHRDDVVLATKFGFTPTGTVSARPEDARMAIDGSLRRLKVEYVDLWYAHRVDPTIPIEETVGAMAEIVTTGKVRHLGLCEASGQTLRRACDVHPIAALQSEWSLWTRDLEPEVLPVARELGVAVVPYSPLGRGMLAGGLSRREDLSEGDHRRSGPRFSEDNFDANRVIVDRLRAEADERGCTPSALALAWLLAQGDDVVPIPGTRSVEHLESNVHGASIHLTPEEARTIAKEISGFRGERYARPHSYGETPTPREQGRSARSTPLTAR